MHQFGYYSRGLGEASSFEETYFVWRITVSVMPEHHCLLWILYIFGKSLSSGLLAYVHEIQNPLNQINITQQDGLECENYVGSSAAKYPSSHSDRV